MEKMTGNTETSTTGPSTGGFEAASGATPEASYSTPESVQEKNARHVFHIFAAVIATAVLVVGLSFFQFYGKFFRERQLISIQQAARADLNLMYQAEMKFHADHGIYTTDLVALDIKPKKVLYKFGFLAPSPAHPELKGLDPSRMNLDVIKRLFPTLEMDFSELTKLSSLDFSKLGSYCADCTASDQTFKVLAVADLSEAPTLDVWTIDQTGKIEHVENDLPPVRR